MLSRLGLFVCHLIGNALLLWLGYYWLGVNEASNGRLLWSVLVVLVFIAGAVWLHGLALAQFSGMPLIRAAERSGRNLLPLIVLALLAIAIYWCVSWIGDHLSHPAYVIGSWLTLHLKKPVSPMRVNRFFGIVLDIMRYVVFPVLLFPLARAIALNGWHGWALGNLRHSRRMLYWLEVGALLYIAIWTPLKLFFWTPRFDSFGAQLVSLAARVAVGYLVFVVAVLAVEFFTSAGRPREIQPSTVVSP